MASKNLPGLITQNVILSCPFDPTGVITEATVDASQNSIGARFTSASNGRLIASDSHWQDSIPDVIRGRTSGSVGPNVPTAATGYDQSIPTVANEFELDVETLTHTWQTMSVVAPLPGSSKEASTTDDINTAQILSLNLDLGMMREIISVQGILWDQKDHPNSTSGHHIRRQHLLDIGRTQWSNVHNRNRVTGFEWNDPNRFIALTIGPKHGMGSTAQASNTDLNYYGDEPSNDVRGSQVQGDGWNRYFGRDASSLVWEWDYELTYR